MSLLTALFVMLAVAFCALCVYAIAVAVHRSRDRRDAAQYG